MDYAVRVDRPKPVSMMGGGQRARSRSKGREVKGGEKYSTRREFLLQSLAGGMFLAPGGQPLEPLLCHKSCPRLSGTANRQDLRAEFCPPCGRVANRGVLVVVRAGRHQG